MNKKIKIKLYRTFPKQFDSSLYGIASSYSGRYDWDDLNEDENKIELEELISENFTKKFADYLKNNHGH